MEDNNKKTTTRGPGPILVWGGHLGESELQSEPPPHERYEVMPRHQCSENQLAGANEILGQGAHRYNDQE